MKIRLLTITHKSPHWIQEGFLEYTKRLPPAYSLELIEIPAEKRSAQTDLVRVREREGNKMLSLTKSNHLIVALDSKGSQWTTDELAQTLNRWQMEGRDVDLLVGGPEGLTTKCLEAATIKWSLSKLTFPHILVKLIVAEQIYRAYTILQHHPYHR